MYSWQCHSDKYLKRLVINQFKLDNRDVDVVTTTKVSSDDSSCITSCIVDQNSKSESRNDRKITSKGLQMLISIFTELKEEMYPLICSKQSYEKSSTSSHSNVEEFNSLWYFKNTLLTPVIKFVSAAVKTHPTSKMDDRYNTLAHLRNNLFEHGGSTMLCQVVQYSQMVAHYKTLGLRTNKYWTDMCSMLLRSPHPTLGFFLLEHPLIRGMFGFNMSVYMACNNKRFRDIHLSLYKDESFEFNRFLKSKNFLD
jgi:hypothetical protein